MKAKFNEFVQRVDVMNVLIRLQPRASVGNGGKYEEMLFPTPRNRFVHEDLSLTCAPEEKIKPFGKDRLSPVLHEMIDNEGKEIPVTLEDDAELQKAINSDINAQDPKMSNSTQVRNRILRRNRPQ